MQQTGSLLYANVRAATGLRRTGPLLRVMSGWPSLLSGLRGCGCRLRWDKLRQTGSLLYANDRAATDRAFPSYRRPSYESSDGRGPSFIPTSGWPPLAHSHPVSSLCQYTAASLWVCLPLAQGTGRPPACLTSRPILQFSFPTFHAIYLPCYSLWGRVLTHDPGQPSSPYAPTFLGKS